MIHRREEPGPFSKGRCKKGGGGYRFGDGSEPLGSNGRWTPGYSGYSGTLTKASFRSSLFGKPIQLRSFESPGSGVGKRRVGDEESSTMREGGRISQ